ncbi:hypothetical protein IWW45_006210 [Coemansia sp. RSA 485]|nr:hypothetical protein IWW45_006210 [Coemansia sp. RSA 485]
MSVQELFKTVNKTRSPINGGSPLGQQGVVRQMSPAMSPSPAPMAAAMMMMSTPENKTASLLQTLIGGGSNRASPVPAAPLFSNVDAGGSDNNRMAMLANLAHTNGIPSSSQLLPQFMSAYPAGSGSMPAASLNAMFGQQHQYLPQSQSYAMGPPGVSPLNAFAFDAQSIMNAYANPGGS